MLQRNRLAPYKLLVYMLYSESEHITRCGQDQVYVTIAPVARMFHVSPSRAKEWFDWLEAAGFIHNYTVTDGIACLKVKLPHWNIEEIGS